MSVKDIDVLCAGLVLVNFPIYPVDEAVFTKDVNMVSPITLLPGGDAANQAIVLSRLGAKVTVASAVGGDGFGKILPGLLTEFSDTLDVSHLAVEPEDSTGVAAMLIRPDGQRNFCINRGSLLKFGLHHIDLNLIDRCRIVSIGGMMSLPGFDGKGAEEVFRRAKESGAITVADTKKDLWGIGLEGIRGVLGYTDYFFPSREEAQAVSKTDDVEKMAQVFLDAGAAHVGIKLGGDGCYFRDHEEAFYVPAWPCKVVDTTGAGDNFMAGFITGLLHGWDHRTCCKFAGAAGAICTSAVGPNSAVTGMEQVLNFIAEAEEREENL